MNYVQELPSEAGNFLSDKIEQRLTGVLQLWFRPLCHHALHYLQVLTSLQYLLFHRDHQVTLSFSHLILCWYLFSVATANDTLELPPSSYKPYVPPVPSRGTRPPPPVPTPAPTSAAAASAAAPAIPTLPPRLYQQTPTTHPSQAPQAYAPHAYAASTAAIPLPTAHPSHPPHAYTPGVPMAPTTFLAIPPQGAGGAYSSSSPTNPYVISPSTSPRGDEAPAIGTIVIHSLCSCSYFLALIYLPLFSG